MRYTINGLDTNGTLNFYEEFTSYHTAKATFANMANSFYAGDYSAHVTAIVLLDHHEIIESTQDYDEDTP